MRSFPDKTTVRVIAILFCLGGLAHWLILTGVFAEGLRPEDEAPRAIMIYFHSLAIVSPLTAIGLWRLRR